MSRMLLALLIAPAGLAAGDDRAAPCPKGFVLYGVEPYFGVSFHSIAGKARGKDSRGIYRTAPAPKDAVPMVEIEQAIGEFEPGVLAIANVTDPPTTLEFKIIPRLPRKNWRERSAPLQYYYYHEAKGVGKLSKKDATGLRPLPQKKLKLSQISFMWVPGSRYEMPDALAPVGSNLVRVPAG